MSTAFVLAGGASLGAIEAGMLQALYEREIAAEVMVGSSAGALNAAFAATHPQTVSAALELQAVWRSTRRRDVFPFSPLLALRALFGHSDHLFSDRGLRRMIEQQLDGVQLLEEAHSRLGLVVTDLLDGEEQLMLEGPLVPALLASAAIPAIFPPVTIAGHLYVDGGIADNTPISQAIALGADTIYVLPTGVSAHLERPPSTPLEMAVHAFNLLLHARLRHEIEALRGKVNLVVLPPPWPLHLLPSDFSHADELIDGGLRSAREALAHADPAAGPTDRAIARLRDPHERAD